MRRRAGPSSSRGGHGRSACRAPVGAAQATHQRCRKASVLKSLQKPGSRPGTAASWDFSPCSASPTRRRIGQQTPCCHPRCHPGRKRSPEPARPRRDTGALSPICYRVGVYVSDVVAQVAADDAVRLCGTVEQASTTTRPSGPPRTCTRSTRNTGRTNVPANCVARSRTNRSPSTGSARRHTGEIRAASFPAPTTLRCKRP